MYEDNERLIQEYQEGRRELLGVIVENNLGLVHAALKSFKWAYQSHPKYDEIISYEDFYQEGVIGLCSCIDKYDPELGAFSTYAMLHIKQAIFRFYYDKGRVVRVPYEPRKLYKALRRAEEEYIKDCGQEPSTKELSLYTGVSMDDILEARRALSDPVYLDSPIGDSEGDSISISDTIPDRTDYLEGTERKLTVQALRKDLKRMAKIALRDDEKVKLLFYYFDNLDKMQVNAISEACGVGRGSLNRFIHDSVGKISRRYLDELIEGYSDLFSSNIRRTRELQLHRGYIKKAVRTVASRMLCLGDSITIIDTFLEDGLKNPVQATVRQIDETGVRVSYIGYDLTKGSYQEKEKYIWFNNIFDFRTENKKLVEIGCMGGINGYRSTGEV